MDILDKLGSNGKMIVLITTLSLLTISIILSISALAISLSNTPEKKSAAFENGDVILNTTKYKWRFTGSKDTGGLCFYATDDKGRETSKSCIEVKNNGLHLNNSPAT
jgi:hypothetical protein